MRALLARLRRRVAPSTPSVPHATEALPVEAEAPQALLQPMNAAGQLPHEPLPTRQRWVQRLRSAWASRVQRAGASADGLQVLQVEGKTYVFGLEWRLIPPTRVLVRTLALARREGKSVYAMSEMEDIIGVGNVSNAGLGLRYSAALQLASKFSQGGLELYAFQMASGQVAVVALSDSRPIPGFDFLGDAAQATGLIDEFLAIQAGQPIRQVGNAGLLEAEESAQPEDLFASPARSARVKSLPGGRSTWWLLALGLALSLAVWGALHWLEQERARVIEENRKARETPDYLYRRSLAQQLQGLQTAGPARLSAWMAVLRQLPMVHHGWRLVRAQCSANECKVQWDRMYGNFSDFMRALPPGTRTADEVPVNNSPVTASILSWHPAPADAAQEARIVPEGLPVIRDGLRQVSDQFQDLALLGQGQAEIDKPSLFAGNANPADLELPVFHGRWSLTQQLWLLPHVRIEPHCVVDLLELVLFDEKGQPASLFKIKGSYYVRAQKTS